MCFTILKGGTLGIRFEMLLKIFIVHIKCSTTFSKLAISLIKLFDVIMQADLWQEKNPMSLY
jgi:hypothetical protein